MTQETGLNNEAVVDHRVRGQGQRPYSLDQLLEEVSAENLHAEVDFGPAEGGEVW